MFGPLFDEWRSSETTFYSWLLSDIKSRAGFWCTVKNRGLKLHVGKFLISFITSFQTRGSASGWELIPDGAVVHESASCPSLFVLIALKLAAVPGLPAPDLGPAAGVCWWFCLTQSRLQLISRPFQSAQGEPTKWNTEHILLSELASTLELAAWQMNTGGCCHGNTKQWHAMDSPGSPAVHKPPRHLHPLRSRCSSLGE